MHRIFKFGHHPPAAEHSSVAAKTPPCYNCCCVLSRRYKRYRGGHKKNWTTANGGKNNLLWAQYVANKYFDTVELKGPRAPIISTKKKKLFATYWGHRRSFLPRLRSFFWQSFWLGASKFHGRLFRATPVYVRHSSLLTAGLSASGSLVPPGVPVQQGWGTSPARAGVPVPDH